jgi:L,D-transpeptidase YbiS
MNDYNSMNNIDSNTENLKKGLIKRIIYTLSIFFIVFSAINVMAYFVQKNSNAAVFKKEEAGNAKKAANDIIKKNKKIYKSLLSLSPKGNYIVIDTSKNILYLKNGDKVLYQAVVSTGSGRFLVDPNKKERKWIFDSPRGEFKIKSKIVEPVWVKPDWAFIEEGMGIPKKYSERIEEGVLGDYALGIGNGYFIHGTLYTRLLGKPVTHGCIRVGDKDLKTIYKAAQIGTKVYIF